MRPVRWSQPPPALPVSCHASSKTAQQVVCPVVGQCLHLDLAPRPLHPDPCPKSIHHSLGGCWAASCPRDWDSTLGDTLLIFFSCNHPLRYSRVMASHLLNYPEPAGQQSQGRSPGTANEPESQLSSSYRPQKRHHTPVSTPGLDGWVAQIPTQLCDLGQASSPL